MDQLVLLVRHAEALSNTEDPSRSLSLLGAEQASRMAGWIASLGLDIGEIRHSGKARARQTAEALAVALGLDRQPLAVGGLAPNDDVEPIAQEFDAGSSSLALVGHLPFMKRLASRMMTGDAHRLAIRVPVAGMILLARQEGRWQLLAFVHPAVLPK